MPGPPVDRVDSSPSTHHQLPQHTHIPSAVAGHHSLELPGSHPHTELDACFLPDLGFSRWKVGDMPSPTSGLPRTHAADASFPGCLPAPAPSPSITDAAQSPARALPSSDPEIFSFCLQTRPQPRRQQSPALPWTHSCRCQTYVWVEGAWCEARGAGVLNQGWGTPTLRAKREASGWPPTEL